LRWLDLTKNRQLRTHWSCRYNGSLTLMSRISVLALAVLFAALPVMACAVPNAEMTPAERECCKKMARQCGDMGMAKSHPCCQSTATPADFHALKTASSQLHHVSLILFHTLPVTSQADACCSVAQWSPRVSCTHSPPGLGSTTTILRI
jgi:cytochrome c556